MGWYASADKFSTRDPTLQVKTSRSQQLAGVLVVLTGVMAAWLLLTQLQRHDIPASPVELPQEATGWDWGAFVFGLGLMLYGLYMFIRPQEYLRMIGSNFPDRRLNPDVVRQGMRVGRIFGIIQVVVGGYMLFRWH